MTTKTKNPPVGHTKTNQVPNPTPVTADKFWETKELPVGFLWEDGTNCEVVTETGLHAVLQFNDLYVREVTKPAAAGHQQNLDLTLSAYMVEIKQNFEQTRLNQDATSKLAADTKILITTLIGE